MRAPSGWSWTSHTPSMVWNWGGSGLSEGLAPGSGELAGRPRPRRPAGAGLPEAAGAAVAASEGGAVAGEGVPISVPGVAALPLGAGGGGGVTAGPGWAT